MKTALLTLNINNVLCENAKSSHLHACERWGCEYVIVDENKFPNSFPSWNKFNILRNSDYERALLIDSDMLISSKCDSPFKFKQPFVTVRDSHYELYTPGYKETDQLHVYIKDYLTRYREEFINDGLSLPCNFILNFFNSGFILFDKSISNVFDKYSPLIEKYSINGSSHKEQALLNYIIQKELLITYITRKWNVINPDLTKPINDSIYHFTGGDPKILKTALESFKWNE